MNKPKSAAAPQTGLPPLEITVMHLEVLVMPNGEVLCNGQTIGWFDQLRRWLLPRETV